MNTETLQNSASFIAYMKKVDKLTSTLPPPIKKDIRMEIMSHIYESQRFAATPNIDLILAHLGDPDLYLPEWIAKKKLDKATQTFNPVLILKGLFNGMLHHTGSIVKYALFALLYIFSFAFAFLAIIKVILPHNTGYFHYANGQYGFGFIRDVSRSNSIEYLGWWFVPICTFASIILYVVVTLLLKASIKFKD